MDKVKNKEENLSVGGKERGTRGKEYFFKDPKDRLRGDK